MSFKPTIAFFGATGGCTIPALAKSISAGHNVVALARTPTKLNDLLVTRGISQAAIDAQLRFVQGSIKELGPVKETLLLNGDVVDLIVSGVGGLLKPGLHTTLDDPTICADAARTIIAALDELRKECGDKGTAKRPVLCAISTTGISDMKRDIPVAMIPLYHWVLKVPHADKKEMERVLQNALGTDTGAAQGSLPPISGLLLVRPSLLVNGHETGTGKLRVGWEGDGDVGTSNMTIGYAITRESVGSWIFEDFIDSAEQRKKWVEKRVVTLTE